ncbi:MAG: DNA-directed RNA polymerase subunit beta' [Bacillales bacterium]|nr:DNA-directed RNA polymerase subunit beta' [Bacillales bacterium]
MFDVNNLAAIQVGLASPEKIREWSYGEVKKPETINYRSQKPEMEGLFCERIFGPAKDYECHCGKYKKIRFSGMVCEKCGVEVTTKAVRRERMGHIELCSPCAHIWYLKGTPSRMSLILQVSPKQLEEVIYFVSRICLNPGTSSVLKYRDVIDEKKARIEFVDAIREIQLGLEPGTYDYNRAEELIARMQNPQETFNFTSTANFISKFTGAEFGSGAEAIKRLLSEVDLDKEFSEISEEIKKNTSKQNKAALYKRLECVEAFRNSNNRPEWMVLDVLPVIPPDLRPMLQLDGGRFATSDLNDLYRRVITRNSRLKREIDMNAPDVILMNEKRMLQEAVDALIDNGRRTKPVTGPGGRALKSLSSTLKGKQGRFRQNLLGKRVDYSGRSVIAVGPFLKMYQCGIPREMAIQLFRPFIAAIMIKEGIATSHKQANKMIDHYDDRVWSIVERVVKEHPVLLNRAPTLHRLGIQAFKPVLVNGRAIRLHPLVCAGFNADFDGDQMAVHVPLSKSAQQEALDLMLASKNILGPKDGKPICTPSQDMILGNYYLTIEKNKEDFLKHADECRARGDVSEAELYENYAASEGKVFKSIDELVLAYQTKQIHLHNRIALKGSVMGKEGFTDEMLNSYLVATVGKVLFNLIFPSDFPFLMEVTKANLKENQISYFVPKGTNIKEYIASQPTRDPFIKKDIGKIVDEIFKRYGAETTADVLDKLKDQGFHYSTLAGITVSIADISVIPGKNDLIKAGEEKVEEVQNLYDYGLLTNEERHKQVVDIWTDVKTDIEKVLKDIIKKDKTNPIFMMSKSGARGNTSNFVQLCGLRGLMAKPSGETIELPIKTCFREGLSVSEFFIATHGARKGGADTALKTADSGYLTRRLVDVSHDVIIREEDCGTDHGFVVSEIVNTQKKETIVSLEERLIGRYTVRDVVDANGEVIVEGNKLMTDKDAKAIVNAGIKEVEIRSLFGCQTKDGVCKHCYGVCLATGKEVELGDAVGVMAAQSIGEPGTQLTMRTFHTGGVAGGDITQGLPRVAELFEARTPKGEAMISKINGKVESIKSENGRYSFTIKNELEEYSDVTNFGARLRVKEGDIVVSGQKITEGAKDPKELLNVSNVTEVEKYIVKEVQKVYKGNGIDVADKHIEVIVRQMLRKILILDEGDTSLLPGTKVDITTFTEKNKEALFAGKRPANGTPIILGITKAALDTESFLSAASFQETTRVLTDAAIKGKIDRLHGLKENVMVGKLIPAGRGLTNEVEEKDDFEVEEVFEEIAPKETQSIEDNQQIFDFTQNF